MRLNLLLIVLLVSAATTTLPAQITASKSGQGDANYVGYRLHLFNLKFEETISNRYTLICDVANTGRQAVLFANRDTSLKKLTLTFDLPLGRALQSDHYDHVLLRLLESKINIDAGHIYSNVNLTWSSDDPTPFDEMFAYWMAPDSTTNETEMVSVKTQKGFEEKKKGIIPDKSNCGDLSFGNITVDQIRKHKLLVRFSLRNIGIGSLQLFDKTNKDDSGLAIRAFFSGTTRLSRGSKKVSVIYLKESIRIQGEQLVLEPGHEIPVEMHLDARDKSRYINVLILEADPFGYLEECKKDNNLGHTILN